MRSAAPGMHMQGHATGVQSGAYQAGGVGQGTFTSGGAAGDVPRSDISAMREGEMGMFGETGKGAGMGMGAGTGMGTGMGMGMGTRIGAGMGTEKGVGKGMGKGKGETKGKLSHDEAELGKKMTERIWGEDGIGSVLLGFELWFTTIPNVISVHGRKAR
ncbi:hypothetical protein BDQ17DRAFT_1336265 [Cyathus striatus]|nr:hypothetical protein BDQ17DRAFT_1336265 [Cyathus striatus]